MTLELAQQPHHDGSALYVSEPHPALGEKVRVRVRVPRAFGPLKSLRTRSNPDHEPRLERGSIVATVDGADWWEADLHVENPVHGYRFLIERVDGSSCWLNAKGLSEVEPVDADDFRLFTATPAPSWVRETVLYQIFPDRFARSAAADDRTPPDWAEPAAWTDPVNNERPHTSHQFYGGDLDGIIEHLDHLERLGVTMIYLTPVFPAGSSHRYDASSFAVVDPLLGGDDALIRLVEAAHERGLKVIGDLTSNHSGDRHEWFQSAYGNPAAPESAFYYWQNEEHTRYASWLGVDTLPKFNWNSTELRRRFIEGPDSVVATWLKPPYSFDGWRIDVANMTGRYLDEDLNAEVRRIIRATMIDVNPDTILLGESTNDASSDFQGDAWHGAMTYANFTRPLWAWLAQPGSLAEGGIGLPLGTVPTYTGEQFHEQHRALAAGFPWEVRLANLNAVDTHDTPRFAGIASPGTAPIAFGLAVTMPGIPVVFAGDEFGLVGRDGEESRTPMPWSTVDEKAAVIDMYADLIALKRQHPALNGGGIRWVHASAEVVAFIRETADESLLVVASRSAGQATIPVDVTGAVQIHGGASLAAGSGAATVTTVDPDFSVWQLAGVTLPAFAV